MKNIKARATFQLFTIMIIVLLILSFSSIIIIYNVLYGEKKILMHELGENQKNLIKSIFLETQDVNKVIDILIDQKKAVNDLGETGEFSIGYLKNDSIFFILSLRNEIQKNAPPVKRFTDLAIPMQLALSGKTGYVEGLDYKGDLVFAYYTYIPELKWGLATKMNISEIRMPFYRAGILVIIISLILFVIATALFRRTSYRLNKKIDEGEENYRRLFEYSAIPIWREDYSAIKIYIDKLKSSGVTDFREYLDKNKDDLETLASSIKVLEINQRSVDFFEVEHKDDVIKNMLFYYTEESLVVFKDQIIALANGTKQYVCEMPIRTLSGDIKILYQHISVVKGAENSLSNVLVSFIDITERKRNDDFLKENKLKLELAMHTANMAWWEMDIATGKVTFDKRKAEMLGYPAENFKHYKDFTALVHAEDYEEAMNAMQKYLHGEADKYEVEYRILNNLGEYIWFYDIGTVVKRDTHGIPKKVTGIVMDISSRKIAEQTLVQSEKKYRLLSENATDMISIQNSEGELTYISPSFTIILGYEPNDLMGTKAADLIYPDDINWFFGELNTQLKNGNTIRTEYRLLKKDGNYIWVENVSNILYDDETNKSTEIISITRNISERKQVEIALSNIRQDLMINEAKLRERVKELNGIYSLGLLTEKFENIEDVYQEFVKNIVPKSMQFSDKVIVSLEIGNDKYSNIENFDLIEPKENLSSPIVIFGRPAGKLIVAYAEELPFIDIFEHNLINTYCDRIAKIIERKSVEDELRTKNKELFDSNATKDKFFKVIAHDMKNPFISLLGASELLFENAYKYDKEKIAKLAKLLHDSAKSGFDMLLNMLEWSRSQAGSLVYQPEKIKLHELLKTNLSNLIETATGKEIKLNFNINEDLLVFADKNMLNAVMRNLVNNALKFTPKGGIVNIGANKEPGYVTIFVEDSGVGIDKNDFDKLFREDIKYSNPGTEHEAGTGLGLLLCKEFVEKQDGKLWFESELGKGSTFYFSLNIFESC
jgi:PAS domain S-box-containing protein